MIAGGSAIEAQGENSLIEFIQRACKAEFYFAHRLLFFMYSQKDYG
jgi:hypothetical protein